jgi:hypothetical protein
MYAVLLASNLYSIGGSLATKLVKPGKVPTRRRKIRPVKAGRWICCNCLRCSWPVLRGVGWAQCQRPCDNASPLQSLPGSVRSDSRLVFVSGIPGRYIEQDGRRKFLRGLQGGITGVFVALLLLAYNFSGQEPHLTSR